MTNIVIFSLASLFSLALIETSPIESSDLASLARDNANGAVARKCSCNERNLKHYKIKECKPVLEDGCDCPVRFDCPKTFAEDESVCYFNGDIYKAGDSIPTKNPCRMCSCGKSSDDKAEIVCVSVECGYMFRPYDLQPGCFRTYKKDECCASGEACDKEANGTSTVSCEFEGKLYHAGQQMYSKENPCMTCICDENWNGVSSSSCTFIDCLFEKNMKYLKRGCVPVYYESSCCPIEYSCPEHHTNTNLIPAPSTGSEPDPLFQCVFGGVHYNLGDTLLVKRGICITCTCDTPPDLTCVQKRCPGPPNNDHVNCKKNYVKGECCPTYECVQQAPIHLICDPVYCREGCSEIMIPNGCPMCQCDEVLCSPPACGPDCFIDYNASPCPACKCAETIPLDRPMCGPVKCGPQCYEAISPQGCPMCVCGPLCSPPKCQWGCHVVSDVPEGQCPYCICDEQDESLPDRAFKVLCSPVRCPSYCSEATGQDGCSKCLCEPMCSPPLCDPGCRAEVVPSSGPCPGCVCDHHEVPLCAPVKCPSGCTEYLPPNSCPLCKCENVLCSMPLCSAGCVLNTNVAPGDCPHCECPDSIPLDRPLCAPVKCGPQCYEAISPQGCPMCVCGPLCSPPKCDPGCEVQTDVPEGQCPGCDCSGSEAISDRVSKVLCAPVRCPLDCREATGPNGCPMCLCDPLCSPPKCDLGCRPEVAPAYGSCPGCVCDRVERPLCGPVFCGPDCYETVSPQGCPMCVCGPQCSPPNCPYGCFIEQNVPVGQCPGCECPPPRYPQYAPAVNDSAAGCPPGCTPGAEEGSTDCICDPLLCSPPNCPQHCTIQKIVPDGTCPGCDCPDTDESGVPPIIAFSPPVPEVIQCSPPKCDPGCSVQKDVPAGTCPGCDCNADEKTSPDESTMSHSPILQCSPPKCEAPCVMQSDVPAGQCPFCNCPSLAFARSAPMMSPPIHCIPGCARVIGAAGISRCVCTPMCSIPRCDPGCDLERPIGACPRCVCPNREERFFPWCPPIDDCGEGCQKVSASNGCDACSCGDKCVPPKCPDSCEVEQQVDANVCPSCRCYYGNPIQVNCPSMPCQLPCRWVKLSESTCPMCQCESPGPGDANQKGRILSDWKLGDKIQLGRGIAGKSAYDE